MAESEAGRSGGPPFARALGEDFHSLHPAVRKHYGAPAVDVTGVMDAVHLKGIIRPLARVSYMLLGFPVPHSGRDVEFGVRNRVDELGAMHWVRTFSENSSFPTDATKRAFRRLVVSHAPIFRWARGPLPFDRLGWLNPPRQGRR